MSAAATFNGVHVTRGWVASASPAVKSAASRPPSAGPVGPDLTARDVEASFALRSADADLARHSWPSSDVTSFRSPVMFHVVKHETDGYNAAMLKGQDVVILLALVGDSSSRSVRELAGHVGYDVGGTHRGLQRLREAGLYAPDRRRVPIAAAEEFLIHGVKYVFPSRRGSETRGVVTAWAAQPLVQELARVPELPPVWPHPTGQTRGIALEPLHPIVPDAALRDPELWERLALVDALRAGDARARGLAEKLLVERLRR